MSFDFGGTYTTVTKNVLIEYTLDDDRKVKISFQGDGAQTKIIQIFDPESENTIELQRGGWQAILNNFKGYTEKN